MTKRTTQTSPFRVPTGNKQGSALLLTLLVTSLLMVIVLAFVVNVRLKLRTIINHQQMTQARANARLGLELAVARLQDTAGPDQRVTGTGSLLAGVIGTGALPDPAVEPRAHWTGVMRSDGSPDAVPPAIDGAGPVAWLVSGVSGGGLAAPPVEVYPAVAGTGGMPSIEAGLVDIRRPEVAETIGRYAFFVEDEGVKAKLRVDAPAPATFTEGSVTPGGFTGFSHLTDWGGFIQQDQDRVPRLNSLRDFELLNSAPAEIADRYRFDYSLHSMGVLSNARRGGLRQDLSTAFADDDAFNAVFDGGSALVMDEEKQTAAPELRPDNMNYIHWNIFRDYAQLYRREEVRNLGRMTAASMSIPVNFSNNQRLAMRLWDHGSFREGPHGFPRYEEDNRTHFVYVDDGDRMQDEVRTDNPLKPVLSHLYARAWVNIEDTSTTAEPSAPSYGGSAFIQPFFGIYNPYNVTLRTAELDMDYDMNVMFRILDANGNEVATSSSSSVLKNGWRAIYRPGVGAGHEASTRFWSSKNEFAIGPGEVLLLMIPGGTVVDISTVSEFEFELTDEFRNISASGYEQPFTFHGGPYTPPFTVEFQTYSEEDADRPYFQLNRGSRAFQPSRRPNIQPYQWFVDPLGFDSVRTWDNTRNYPGKRVVVENVLPGADNYNNAAHFGMWLRTTREADQGIRPLIDGNIRAAYINPRWDVSATGAGGGLGLRTPAAYTGLPRDLNASGADRTVFGLDFNLWGIYDGQLLNPTGGLAFPQFRNEGGQMKGWWGEDHTSLAQPRIPLFDIPRHPLVSIGQFQHAEAGHYSYEPSYIPGNSYANPRIPLDDWRHSDARDRFLDGIMSDPFKISGTFNLYDASYLVNEVMWDDYTFTTLAEHFGGDTEAYGDLLAGKVSLRNARYRPYVPAGFAFSDTTLAQAGQEGILRNAAFVMADGAFNVNSTSVRAWEAFLSSTAGLPVARLNTSGLVDGIWEPDDVRYPRLSSHPGGAGDFWEGFGTLSATQVRGLAEAMVEEVRQRGPFRNLGEFINRDLRTEASDAERKSGALQAALDATVNRAAFVDGHGDEVNMELSGIPSGASQATGFPGHMLQGDLLQALGPYLSTRSDTFKIRAYGETFTAADPVGIWCEAIVQRVPDPLRSAGASLTEQELQEGDSHFGRRFKIVSFQWIAP